ncbi:hypothetical protein HMPREF9154_0069 [Arachnia propionica F0230a]|nr:hypothetical protein HMPREF9154_0069 [Arachnia propionica F0230a]
MLSRAWITAPVPSALAVAKVATQQQQQLQQQHVGVATVLGAPVPSNWVRSAFMV